MGDSYKMPNYWFWRRNVLWQDRFQSWWGYFLEERKTINPSNGENEEKRCKACEPHAAWFDGLIWTSRLSQWKWGAIDRRSDLDDKSLVEKKKKRNRSTLLISKYMANIWRGEMSFNEMMMRMSGPSFVPPILNEDERWIEAIERHQERDQGYEIGHASTRRQKWGRLVDFEDPEWEIAQDKEGEHVLHCNGCSLARPNQECLEWYLKYEYNPIEDYDWIDIGWEWVVKHQAEPIIIRGKDRDVI